MSQRNDLVIKDPTEPHDWLDVSEVGGYGEPMLALFCTQSEPGLDCETAGVNLTIATATTLRDWLTAWLEKQADP